MSYKDELKKSSTDLKDFSHIPYKLMGYIFLFIGGVSNQLGIYKIPTSFI